MLNKKIKNATPKEYNGIKFRSLLEVMTYKTLLQEGFLPEYENMTFTLKESFQPSVPFYTKNTLKRKNKNVKVLSKTTIIDNRVVKAITYTPDFIFNYKDKVIIVEVKGMANDVYPYKLKLFRNILETLSTTKNYELWEIHSQKQLLDCIKHLKNE